MSGELGLAGTEGPPTGDRVRIENILWLHQRGYDFGPGGWTYWLSTCHGCDWRSDRHDLKAYADAAHVRHVADLLLSAADRLANQRAAAELRAAADHISRGMYQVARMQVAAWLRARADELDPS